MTKKELEAQIQQTQQDLANLETHLKFFGLPEIRRGDVYSLTIGSRKYEAMVINLDGKFGLTSLGSFAGGWFSGFCKLTNSYELRQQLANHDTVYLGTFKELYLGA